MKFSIKSLLVVTTIVAGGLGTFIYMDALERERKANMGLAKEFMDTHGTWEYFKEGDVWDLSGLSDLTLDEIALLQYVEPYDRERILSIDLSNTNVTDEHMEFIRTLPRIEELDLRNTKVTKTGVGKILELPRYHKPEIKHDRQDNAE